MSQDAHLFSARRPRETLGPLSTNMSAIPLPMSAVKRSSSISYNHQQQQQAPSTVQHKRSASASRMSLMPNNTIQQPRFQRASSGNFGDMLTSTSSKPSGGNLFASAVRKSLAPNASGMMPTTPAPKSSQLQDSTLRRSSVYGRSSMGAQGHSSFFAAAAAQPNMSVDPRDLRNPATKNQFYLYIVDFLGSRSFDTTQFGGRLKNSPQQKDFQEVFKFIYHCIDPSFDFGVNRNLNTIIQDMLKDMRYPYYKNISNGQLSAISSNNWHVFLGLLHWMAQLANMMDGFEAGTYDEASENAGYDVATDRITSKFLSEGYQVYLSTETDEDANELMQPHLETMAAAFEATNQSETDSLARFESHNEALQAQLDELGQIAPRLCQLENDIKILGEDVLKCQVYIKNASAMAQTSDERNAAMRQAISQIEQDLAQAEEQRRQYQHLVDEKGIAIADIDRMNSERTRLESGNEGVKARLAERVEAVNMREAEAHRLLDELKDVVDVHNSLCWQIEQKLRDRSLGEDKRPRPLIVKLAHPSDTQNDILVANADAGHEPRQVIDIANHSKHDLVSLRRAIAARRNNALESDMGDRDLLHKTREATENKQAEVEKLRHVAVSVKEAFEKEKEITTAKRMGSDTHVEKMEKKLSAMRLEIAQSAHTLEQEEMSINIEFEQMQEKAVELRKTLNAELDKMLNEVVQLKISIQKGLERYEEFVTQEGEKEIEEHDAVMAGVDTDGET